MSMSVEVDEVNNQMENASLGPGPSLMSYSAVGEKPSGVWEQYSEVPVTAHFLLEQISKKHGFATVASTRNAKGFRNSFQQPLRLLYKGKFYLSSRYMSIMKHNGFATEAKLAANRIRYETPGWWGYKDDGDGAHAKIAAEWWEIFFFGGTEQDGELISMTFSPKLKACFQKRDYSKKDGRW